MRPSKRQYLMRVALLTAERSTCSRLQVGAVLADTSLETFVIGYNGSYKGGPNECRGDVKTPGGCGCVHAEVNAVAKAGRGRKILFVTHAPCLICATLLVNADVREVYYNQLYRSEDGISLLKEAGIGVFECPV